MSDHPIPHRANHLHLAQHLAEQLFSRAAGADLVQNNSVKLLKDAGENYPAWLSAIAAAQDWIHFESYIIHEDAAGWRFADALVNKAKQGVKVKLLYDWMGGFGKTSSRFWNYLRDNGVEVRCFNPIRIDSPLGWLNRDHRKSIVVDGCVGFVTGLCVGQMWEGNPARGLEPWRDTGLEIRGPAVADISRAFGQVWALCGSPLPPEEITDEKELQPAGETAVRVIGGEPRSLELYRLDQLIALGARERLWLTDAYFVASNAYVQALRSAARDGVDVRLLVPGASDISIVQSISRSGYRPLLEAGVRVFEWNGPMLHAKSAVADSHWGRVGSTNLNIASWAGNWELDAAIEDEQFAQQLEKMYEDDLTHATEIVLNEHSSIQSVQMNDVARTGRERPKQHRKLHSAGSTNRAAAGAIAVGNALGAAVAGRRSLGTTEANLIIAGGAGLLLLAIVGVIWPRVITIPLAVFGAWIAISILVKGARLRIQDQEDTGNTVQNTQPNSPS